ncbi:uncharacterized protein LOC121983786 [Zingiber officinale]|uniref:uncharacterized protein LOC121983786 n=1 Tax=Zingiber officinale TaxID=94328 RepID=UPI001C4A7C88|nr:uncharacterized protein LOC121983786 [Zingiber officinale]
MKLNVPPDRLEVRPSMEIFRFRSSCEDDGQWMNREMHAKLEELESFYAAYEQSRARRSGSQADDFGDSVEFDGDLLLKMVDELERNMRLSRSEVAKGRAYEDYAARRGAKLREEEVGWKGKQRRREMETMENRFEKNWVELKARRRDAPKTEHKEEPVDNSIKKHKEKPPPKSSSKNKNLDSSAASARSLPSFSSLRKENLKPTARADIKAANHYTPSRTGRIPARSKSTANLGESKNLASSKVSKDQKRKTFARGMERCKSSAVLEEATIQNSIEVEELRGRAAAEETSIFHIELDGEEPRPSQESEICDDNLEKHEISKGEAEAGDELVDVSKSNSALDSEKEPPEEKRAEEAAAADASRARKKWAIAEKPSIATSNSSDNLLKDVAKQLKKLIKIGRKDRIASNVASASSDSGVGGGLKEDKIFPRQDQSLSFSFSASPANIKLMEDDQSERFPKSPCFVFPFLPLHGRNEARFNGKPRVPASRVL